MKIRHWLSIVALGVSLALLVGPSMATPPAEAEAASGSLAELPFDPAEVAFVSRNAVHAEGGLLVADNSYRRVEFTAEGVRFAPREDGELTPGHDLSYRLAEVRSGRHVYLASPTPVSPLVAENQVDYSRPAGITERYVVGDESVEQLFILDGPLALDGDLEVVGQLDTTLTPILGDPLMGLHFFDREADVLHYSGALVFDAAGRETPAPLSLDGDRVTITVPADWLADAVYPVTIDPELEGGVIEIGPYPKDESNPAVAYSTASGQYLVVWEYDKSADERYKDIAARYVEGSTGETLHSYIIAKESEQETNPDVAYDPDKDRFLVVWDEYYCDSTPPACNYFIKGRLLDGTLSDELPYSGSKVVIASKWPSYDLCDPAVAYNADDHQFLVVYLRRAGGGTASGDECATKTYTNIDGQRVDSQTTDPNYLGDPWGFEIRGGTSTCRLPDVAWSRGGNTFLAVWEAEPPSDVNQIHARYVYDTYEERDTQVYGTGPWKIAPYDRGSDPLTNDCSAPAASYDPAADAYVVAFNHEESTFSHTIHGQRVRSLYITDTFRYDADYAFPIETDVGGSFTSHWQPDIAPSGIGDEMHVIYVSDDLNVSPDPSYYWIYDRTLNGTSVGSRLEVRSGDDDKGMENPAAACSRGRCLMVWREEYTTTNWNILGQRVWSDLNEVYLPLILRNQP